MDKVYVIELEENDRYDTRIRTMKLCFTTYEVAKEFLLKDFECHESHDGSEWFSLQEGKHYCTEYMRDTSAEIVEMKVFNKEEE